MHYLMGISVGFINPKSVKSVVSNFFYWSEALPRQSI